MNGTRRQEVRDLAAALTVLTDLMLATPSVDDLLGDLARLAADVVAPPAACGVTLRRNSHPVTVATSAALASDLDEAQYDSGEGPCVQAMYTGEAVSVPDFTAESRWGAFPSNALAYGIRSSLSLPLEVDGDTRGAMNLYARAREAFAADAERRATLFAAQASAALTVVTRQARHVELTAQLRGALASRTVIDQAIGILMAQQRCDADTGFGLLRAASQHQNRKLREVARDIVRAVGGEEPYPGPFTEPAK
jgi:GAF domain-containing protein